ncbi:glycosyl hydrolase family 28-related protein [Aridibaculum aurantiacum]|uniref:glycosyl hydrolase family 28-related protein n=1 Tax=Aridibaculum aurantiacum TaxID=2810307 RepID=UPI001A95D024|nr:glycosyl hydrolase family 28-related protein [Aridibaculum aurantiacum]
MRQLHMLFILLLVSFTAISQVAQEAVPANQVFSDKKNSAAASRTGTTQSRQVISGLVDDFTGEPVSYTRVTKWIDGTAMNDSKVDGVIFRKRGNEYYQRNTTNSDINVKWFGARGDGVTDDTKAITDAISFSSAASQIDVHTRSRVLNLIFPAGTYITSATIRQNENGKFVHLVGMADATILYRGSGAAIHIGNNTPHGIMPIEVKNLTIKKENTSAGSVGLLLEHAAYSKIINVGFEGFETAFLNKGSIGVLADGGGKQIAGSTIGVHVISSKSNNKDVLRFASNAFALRNYTLGKGIKNAVVIEPGKGVSPGGSGGMITLDRLIFEGVEGTSLKVVNNGEVGGLDVVQVRDCWFEHYGDIGINIFNARVKVQNSFFAGAKKTVVLVNDDNSSITMQDTHGYFLDTRPTNNVLIQATGAATKAVYKNIKLLNCDFRGLTKLHADYPVSSSGISAEGNVYTISYNSKYPSGNNDYNRNLSINLFAEIEKLVGPADHVTELVLAGNDGTPTIGFAKLTIVKRGSGYTVKDDSGNSPGFTIRGEGRNTVLAITDATTGRWFNAIGKYSVTLL